MRIVKRNAGYEFRSKKFRPMFVIEQKEGKNKYREILRGDIDAARSWLIERIEAKVDIVYLYEDFSIGEEVFRIVEKQTEKGELI